MRTDQIAINAISTRHAGLVECVDAYAAAGFKHVEFPLGDVKTFLGEGHAPADVRRLLDERRVDCIGGWEAAVVSFGSEEERQSNQQQLLDNAQLLAELGGKSMVVGTDGPADGQPCDDPLGALAEGFRQVGDLIAPTGVTLCLEFNWSPVVKSLRTAAEVARRADRPNVGVLFDPAHYHCTPTKFDQLTPENVGLVRHVHVDDMRDKPGELSDCNGDRVLPGEGCLDLGALFGRLEELGYDGYFSIEMFNEELWGLPAREAAARMYQSMLTLAA